MTGVDALSFFAVAFIGGAINSVAGGGTFLTFPVLILSGMSALTANIVSTLALWPGSVAGAVAYRREWWPLRKILPVMLLISIIGSSLGAYTLLHTPETTFSALVPWLLLAATLIFTFGRRVLALLRIHALHEDEAPSTKRRIASVSLQGAIAFYGGYFGAGIGILMLAMLQLLGFSHIHRMNALKTVLGSAINAVAVVMFIASGRVPWAETGVMIAGGIMGGYAGARVALKMNPTHVRAAVSLIGFATCIYFFTK